MNIRSNSALTQAHIASASRFVRHAHRDGLLADGLSLIAIPPASTTSDIGRLVTGKTCDVLCPARQRLSHFGGEFVPLIYSGNAAE